MGARKRVVDVVRRRSAPELGEIHVRVMHDEDPPDTSFDSGDPEYKDQDPEQVKGALKEQVRHVIGAFAAPDVIHVASGLPKTRSGKIMRRILRKIAASEYEGLGDTSTLAEPDVVERLVAEHKAAQE